MNLSRLLRAVACLVCWFAATHISAARESVTGAWVSSTKAGEVLRCFYDQDRFYTRISKPKGTQVFSGLGTYTFKDGTIEYTYTTSSSDSMPRGAQDRETITVWRDDSFEVVQQPKSMRYTEVRGKAPDQATSGA